jgi:hypothetical protein
MRIAKRMIGMMNETKNGTEMVLVIEMKVRCWMMIE